MVGLGQAILFLRQFHFMSQSVDAANKAAMAADVSAQTASEAFTKLERPYLFVYGVTTIMHDPNHGSGFEPFVRFEIANHGKTPAIIESAAIGFSVDSISPHAPPYVEQEHELQTHPILGAGQVRKGFEERLPLGIGVIETGSSQMLLPDIEPHDQLFLQICIQYKGAFTEGHETSCCWRYDRMSGHFVQVGLSNQNFIR